MQGQINITQKLEASLQEYVKNGGILVMNAGQIYDNGTQLFDMYGISGISPEVYEDYIISACEQDTLPLYRRNCLDRTGYIEESFQYHKIEASETAVLAACRDASPAATGHRYGNGLALLMAITGLSVGRVHHDTLRFERTFLGSVARLVTRAAIYPRKDVSWMITKCSDGNYRVLVINYGNSPWKGGIILFGLDVNTAWSGSLPEGWYYEGGGIYRHARLLYFPELHIAPHGVFAHSDVDMEDLSQCM